MPNKLVRAYLRARPLLQREVSKNDSVMLQVQNNVVSVTDNSSGDRHDVEFDACFHPESSPQPEQEQQKIFEEIKSQQLDAVLNGHNAFWISIGFRDAGKSYTMFGTDDCPGLIPRIWSALQSKISADPSSSSPANLTVSISFFEILNYSIQDLLSSAPHTASGPDSSPTSSTPSSSFPSSPKSKSASDGRVYMDNLTEKEISSSYSYGDFAAAGKQGQRGPFRGSSVPMVPADYVFVFRVRYTTQVNGETVPVSTLFTLIDMDSSCKDETAASFNDRMGSTSSVVRVLEQICARNSGRRVLVPFKDNLVTRLLTHQPGDPVNICLFAHVSPASSSLLETLFVLDLCRRAKGDYLHSSLEDEDGDSFREEDEMNLTRTGTLVPSTSAALEGGETPSSALLSSSSTSTSFSAVPSSSPTTSSSLDSSSPMSSAASPSLAAPGSSPAPSSRVPAVNCPPPEPSSSAASTSRDPTKTKSKACVIL